MLKGDIINGYCILEDFKVAGGTSKVSFAEKMGEVYFIKEFLSPKYPTPDSPGSDKIKMQKRNACDEFEKHHKELNAAIGKCCVGKGGNLIYALDFFRNGASYYKVTEKIDVASISCDDIARLPIDKILLIAKSAVHSIKILHTLGIVHGDLKPDNLLIKEASKGFVTKLIDFDDSYFEKRPPKDRDCLVGTPEYYSPEQADYIMDEDEELDGSTLTCKSDIFTLGIILCEYFTGKKPLLGEGYKTVWSYVKDGQTVSFAKDLTPKIKDLLLNMLLVNPEKRPSINEVFLSLRNVKDVVPETVEPSGSKLRLGHGFVEKDPELMKGSSGEKKSCLRGLGLKIASKTE